MGRGRGSRTGAISSGENVSEPRTEVEEAVENDSGITPGSSFAVKARKITILPHDNADALELAKIDDYLAVVGKGQFQTGDVALYLPESSILPDNIIEDLGLEGKLAGGTFDKNGKKNRNRVKAVRLRGVLSQGLVYQPEGMELAEGEDYTDTLGVTKWAPPIPSSMNGDVKAAPDLHSYTSIENIKKFPDVIKEGEEVLFTEKLHGTCTIVAFNPNAIDAEDRFQVSSKGHASRGRSLIRDLDDEGKDKNVYWRMASKYDLEEKLARLSERYPKQKIQIFGETLGVQDLNYGLQNGELDFRIFDIAVNGEYVDCNDLNEISNYLDIPQVPVLYQGSYDKQVIENVATGKEQFTGTEAHLREGGVLRPVTERRDDTIGRVILKVISPDYLTRKGDATEYE